MNKHCDSIPVEEFLDLIEVLGLTEKESREFLGIERTQFYHWKKKGRMPTKHYWAFQKEMCVFLDKENLRKKVALGIISKEFLKELLDE